MSEMWSFVQAGRAPAQGWAVTMTPELDEYLRTGPKRPPRAGTYERMAYDAAKALRELADRCERGELTRADYYEHHDVRKDDDWVCLKPRCRGYIVNVTLSFADCEKHKEWPCAPSNS